MNTGNASGREASPLRPSIGRLLGGVLLSLVALPGLGHRMVGRKTAFRVIVFLFFLSFALLGFFLYHTVHEAVMLQMQKTGQPDLALVMQVAMDSLKNGSNSCWSLILLLAVYFGAPLELVVNEVLQRLRASR